MTFNRISKSYVVEDYTKTKVFTAKYLKQFPQYSVEGVSFKVSDDGSTIATVRYIRN